MDPLWSARPGPAPRRCRNLIPQPEETHATRTGRTARARATRARVVEAAAPLFVERGCLETTMADLARAAGVAVQTLYPSFGSKAAVLEAVLDDGAQDHPSGWPDTSDGPAALAQHVAATCAAVERRYPLDAVLRAAAADPEPAALAERPGFTPHLSLQRATDVLAALLSPETYGLLVVDQGWTTPDWSEWAARHLATDLFPKC